MKTLTTILTLTALLGVVLFLASLTGCGAACPTQPEKPFECFTAEGTFQNTPANEWGTSVVVTPNDTDGGPCTCTVHLIAEEDNGRYPVSTQFTGVCP